MPEEVSGSDLILEDGAAALPSPDPTDQETEAGTLSGNDSISGNDTLIGQGGSVTDQQIDPAQLEAVVVALDRIDQHVVNASYGICILIGILIGIVFTRGFAIFVKGV